MIERDAARALAQKAVHDRQGSVSSGHLLVIDPDRFTETREGWYFPYSPAPPDLMGSTGVIVHKRTGRVFVLGSAFSVERDIRAFDEGFQFEIYDLVILEIMDRERTVDTLVTVGPTVITPEYEYGTVWRIPHRLSKQEIELRLAKLPVVFPQIGLYFCIEALQVARDNQYFQFEALECRWRWKGP
jgi:hypothetical protein